MKKRTPLASYDLENNKVEDNDPSIVWSAILDKRYKLEVVRNEKSRTGTLVMFDSSLNDEVLLEEEVNLSYGAAFGPDVMDVAVWEEMAIKVVDEKS